ncbi:MULTISPECIES: beta-ketoacyl-ACP synthase III [unclassified Nocardiopsis]|uniref:beta-ketoacyl-ACP synthase III n=1 Tax=unclassified Nocardiopsis TaxID=2649073 RepID=UPI00135A62D3|nr:MULTISPECIES: beta-ketoacyl-ACP synthase III [unclassified Nocardiopsis]
MRRTAVIAGVGGAVPSRIVTNHELSRRLDTSDEWIRTRTGIRQRHVVEPGVSTGDLATEAGSRAMKQAGMTSTDLVVVATTTPDRPCPATAPTVATRMGLVDTTAFDVSAVCSGFVYGLQVATAAVTAGMADSAVVIGAESFTTILDPDDRTTVAIFGDGAGALALRAGRRDEDGAVLDFDTGSDGSLRDLITVPAGGSEQRATGMPAQPDQAYFRMEGQSVFAHAVRRMADTSRRALSTTGWGVGEVDRFVGHQANRRILQAVAEQLGIDPDRAVSNIERVGNTAAASIPLALADSAASGLLGQGDRVLLAAFGGGATWGAATLTWPGLPGI